MADRAAATLRQGVTAAELERLARTRTNLAGMQRWRFTVVGPVVNLPNVLVSTIPRHVGDRALCPR